MSEWSGCFILLTVQLQARSLFLLNHQIMRGHEWITSYSSAAAKKQRQKNELFNLKVYLKWNLSPVLAVANRGIPTLVLKHPGRLLTPMLQSCTNNIAHRNDQSLFISRRTVVTQMSSFEHTFLVAYSSFFFPALSLWLTITHLIADELSTTVAWK